MDPFSACLAFGPLAIYLLSLAMMNLSRRPQVVNGTREWIALALALLGLMLVGPMRLFMPLEAAAQFGETVWLLLLGFYVLCVMLVIMLSRPRLVIYNITVAELYPALDEVARRIDPGATWAGKALSMPYARMHLQIESFSPLGNVSLVATSDDQSIAHWRRLERTLRARLQETPVAGQTQGLWLAMTGCALLAMLGWWVVRNPQLIAHGMQQMFLP